MIADHLFFTCINILLAWSVYVSLLTGSLSFAQGAFMAVGCYASGYFTAKMGLPMLPATGLAALISALIAALVGYPALRLRGIYLILATLGLTFGLKALAVMAIGGMGDMRGAVLAGLGIGVLEALMFHFGLGRLGELTVWAAMIATLLLKPAGLFASGHHGQEQRV